MNLTRHAKSMQFVTDRKFIFWLSSLSLLKATLTKFIFISNSELVDKTNETKTLDK